MNFDFGKAVKAKESTGKRLTPGLHNAEFVRVEKTIINTKNGDAMDAMSLVVNIDGYGEYTQNFFEPTSNERTSGTYGDNPSQVEQFMIAVRIILEALNPDYATDIENGTLKIGGNFTQVINAVKKYSANYSGKKVMVKLLPQSNGFVSMPSFPARVTKNGDLGIQTRFMGEVLTLSSSEEKKIQNANNAAPTVMASVEKGNDMLDALKKDLDITDNDSDESEDDLPF